MWILLCSLRSVLCENARVGLKFGLIAGYHVKYILYNMLTLEIMFVSGKPLHQADLTEDQKVMIQNKMGRLDDDVVFSK